MFTCLHVDREMSVSLEEAISCPPPLFSTSSKAEKDIDNTKAKNSAASGASDVKRSVLYAWCDRPTIHSFMDTVLSLSLKKKQQEHLQQQIQEQEQKQKQEQLQYLKHQMKQQKHQQFQQQNNPLSLFSENLQSKGLSKETISQSQSIPGDVHLQDVSQRRPKVKKVMKGGVLVSMPCGPRQPTIGGRPNFEIPQKAEKNQLPFSNYRDTMNNFSAGNILDDILARAKDGSCTPSFTKMSQAPKKSDAVGDTGEISLGHESDSSVSSGEFQPTTNITNTDFNPANKSPKYGQLFEKSCGKSSLESFTCTGTSSDSSCDDQILSSFDRIRSLQFQNENVLSNKAETSEGQSSKQAVPASTGFFKGTLSSLVDEDEIPLRKLQETLFAEERTNLNYMPSEKQQNKDLFSEKPKVVIGMETSAQKMDADCKMTQTKGWNDGMLQNMSMLVQTQSPETTRMDNIKEFKENDKKRKEILDETSSSIETKEKRMKETEKNINSVRITRSHGSTEKLPTDTKTQSGRAAKSFPRNNEPSMEMSEDVPSLISMVSNEVLDITVVEKELLRKKSSGGRKKKKRNKPTEWFLRKMAQEKELKNNPKPPEFIPPVCFYFSKGTCAKGSMCQFKHEKTKELCGYYAGSGECYKFQDGMCPNLHSEFPCKFFHIHKFCWNEDNCRFSHEPLTEEMRDVLDNHLLTIEQRNKQGDTKALESSSSITEKSEMNETFKEICPVDKTGGRLSSTFIVPAPIIPVKQSPPANTLKYPVPTEHSGKSINSPKVKRLCSLSSYKPQFLSSLTSSIKSFELSSPKDKIPSECNPKDSPQIQDVKANDTKLQFLPGIFKER